MVFAGVRAHYTCMESLPKLLSPSPPNLPPYKQWSEVNSFVQSVNTVLVAQTETERVRDAMSRIVSFSAVDIPGEYREVSHVTIM